MMHSHWRRLLVVWRSRHAAGVALTSNPQPLPSLLSSSSFRQASSSSSSSGPHSKHYRAVLCSIGSAAGIATALHYYTTTTSRVYCRHTSTHPQSDQTTSPNSPLPPVTLYEYPACPFCSKVRAFCDYYNITYTAVSVNPVSRKEIEFSKSKQLPFIVVDGVKV